MDIKILNKDKSVVELTIEVTPEELAPYREEAVKHLSEQVEVQGFRKGKAPKAMVEKKLDPAKILEETANKAIPKIYGKVVLEKKLEVIGSPKVEITKFAPGNPLVFKASVAVLPKFDLPDYKNIKVEKKAVKVDDEQVNKLLKRLQRDHAVEKPVERAAAKGDAVEIDFDLSQKKVPLEDGQGRNHPLVIGDGLFVPGFEDELVGLKKDEEKEFSLKFPDDYNKKSLAGQTGDFKVKMLSVKEREVPALDDAFAKRVGKFESFADLKKQLHKNLELDEQAKEEQRFESEVLTKLADETKIEIPDILLQSETDKMGRELEQSLVQQGANLKDYLTSINKTLDQLKKGWVEQATKRVKIGLLLRAIAKEEKVEVSDKDVEEEINMSLKQNPGNKEVEDTVKSPAYKDYVSEVIRNRKIIKLLSSLAEDKK